MSLSVYDDNRKKDILMFGKGPIQGLDNTALTEVREYAIKIIDQHKNLC